MKRLFSEENLYMPVSRRARIEGDSGVRQVKSTGDLSLVKVVSTSTHIVQKKREDNWYEVADIYYGRPNGEEEAEEDTMQFNVQKNLNNLYEFADISYCRPEETEQETALLNVQKDQNDLGGFEENDFPIEYQHKKFRKVMLQIRQERQDEYLHKKFRRDRRFNIRATEYYHKKFRRAERQRQMSERGDKS